MATLSISPRCNRPTSAKFLADELSAHRTPSHAHAVTSGLRRYLRYRRTQGEVVEPLIAVIASPAHWTLAPLPKALTREEVARLLDGCQAVRRWPKRGYAMVRCALDLARMFHKLAASPSTRAQD
jgi:integrase